MVLCSLGPKPTHSAHYVFHSPRPNSRHQLMCSRAPLADPLTRGPARSASVASQAQVTESLAHGSDLSEPSSPLSSLARCVLDGSAWLARVYRADVWDHPEPCRSSRSALAAASPRVPRDSSTAQLPYVSAGVWATTSSPVRNNSLRAPPKSADARDPPQMALSS